MSPARAALTLALLAGVGAATVDLAQHYLSERIARNEARARQERLEGLLADVSYDNDVSADRIEVSAPTLDAEGAVSVYRARSESRPAALVLEVAAKGGYNGTIRSLVAVRPDGRLLGLALIDHRETPGLGDRIDPRRSGWAANVVGRGLDDPPLAGWKVRRDGGAIDQLTGATITTRAMVTGLLRCLQFHDRFRVRLYAAPSGTRLRFEEPVPAPDGTARAR